MCLQNDTYIKLIQTRLDLAYKSVFNPCINPLIQFPNITLFHNPNPSHYHNPNYVKTKKSSEKCYPGGNRTWASHNL